MEAHDKRIDAAARILYLQVAGDIERSSNDKTQHIRPWKYLTMDERVAITDDLVAAFMTIEKIALDNVVPRDLEEPVAYRTTDKFPKMHTTQIDNTQQGGAEWEAELNETIKRHPAGSAYRTHMYVDENGNHHDN